MKRRNLLETCTVQSLYSEMPYQAQSLQNCSYRNVKSSRTPRYIHAAAVRTVTGAHVRQQKWEGEKEGEHDEHRGKRF